MKRPSDLQAIGFAVAGFTLWVFCDTTIKVVGRSGLPLWEVIGFLGLFISGFLLLHGIVRHDLPALRPHRLGPQLVRGCLDLGNNFCVVLALRHLSLTLFYILVFAAPMVTAILSAIFLREPLPWRKALAILTGFAGVVVAVDPFGSARQGDLIGYLACAVCVACFSTNMTWSRVLTRTETPQSLTLVSGLIQAVAGFGLMLWHAQALTPRLLGLLVAIGFFCTAGTLCFFHALRHTTAANVSQYHYTQLLTGAILAWFLWRQKPTTFMVLGAVLIVASGLYIAIAARLRADSDHPLPPIAPGSSGP